MASTFTISEILSDAAVLANSPAFSASTRVTTTQATYWLNQAIRAFGALMRQHFPDDRELIQSATLPTTPNFAYVSLPTDCGEVHAVLWQRATDDLILLESAQQDDLTETLDAGQRWETPPRWRLEGQTLGFYPDSAIAENIIVFYTINLTATTTILGRVDMDRWLSLDVAERVCTAKSMSGKTAELRQQKALLENDLLSRARARDVNKTHTIRDVRTAHVRDYLRSRWGA